MDREVIPESYERSWQEQQALVGEQKYVPTFRQIVYHLVLYYKIFKHSLMFKDLVHTSDRNEAMAPGKVPYIGSFTRAGMRSFLGGGGGHTTTGIITAITPNL